MKEKILSCLSRPCPWSETLHWYDCVGSTNTLAKELAAQGAPHGTVLVAGAQSQGRGRMGRSFLSPPDTGVYLSVLLRPDCPPQALMHLTCAAAVAAAQAVEAVTGVSPKIKWINDLVMGNRKVAGILTELSMCPGTGKIDYAVIGIGINCRQKPSDFPPELAEIAGSLSMATGRDAAPAAVAAALVESLYRMDQQLLTGKREIMARYRELCLTLGREVSLLRSGEVRHGRVLDMDDDGALLVQLADGHTEWINSGEASVRGLYGYV